MSELKRYDYEDTKYQDIDCEYVKYDDVKTYPEMLEILIKEVKRIKQYKENNSTPNQLLDFIYQDSITIIEKATNQKIEDLL